MLNVDISYSDEDPTFNLQSYSQANDVLPYYIHLLIFFLFLPKPDLVIMDKFLARCWFIHCPNKNKTLCLWSMKYKPSLVSNTTVSKGQLISKANSPLFI